MYQDNNLNVIKNDKDEQLVRKSDERNYNQMASNANHW